jgi:hypothetical protein
MRLSFASALVVASMLGVFGPGEAAAAPVTAAALPMATAVPDRSVENVYYYRGRQYPYRYRGRYYSYRYKGRYYQHRYQRHGQWHYY